MLNRYSYCRNNPLIYTDPTGHLPDGGYGSYGKTGNIDGDKGRGDRGGGGIGDAWGAIRDFFGGFLGMGKSNPNTGTIKDPWATRFDLKAPINPKYDITSHFGWRIHPIYKRDIMKEYGKIPNFERNEQGNLPTKKHQGIDIACPIGTPVEAPEDGVVKAVNPDPNTAGGKTVTVTCKTTQGKVDVTVMHCNEVNVKKDQTVTRGQSVAETGNTGSSTTGAHAHVETRVDGRLTDPRGVFPDYDKARRR